MTIRELATNWIENDRTGDYCREITLEDAMTLISYMDQDTIDSLDEEITPETFMAIWNDIIREG